MSESTSNNKRIAKNTIYLYIRQLITMAVTLYTVRIVLDVLGVVDYGIYNVVGGIVAMFGFLSGTMASATQRYLSFEMGKKEQERINEVFSLSVNIYIILILVILVLAETLGLWFLNNKMTIPENRLFAANCVYQSAIVSFMFTIVCIPYNASIIAMEKMEVYAIASVVDALLKLFIVFLLPLLMYDCLVSYSVLMVLVVAGVQTFYAYYCLRHFDFCHYRRYKNLALLKEMSAFAGWNSIGALANFLRSQGLNILLNIFFNPAVNAARAVAYQVNGAVNHFANNFYSAVRPQLSKYYAGGERGKTIELGLNSTRYAYFLMLLITVPILCETNGILSVWLKETPENTVVFLRITLLQELAEIIGMPIAFMLQASGRIKELQLSVSILYLLNLPISYLLLHIGYPAVTVFYVNLILVTLSFIPRLWLAKYILGLDLSVYCKEVILRVVFVSIPLAVWCWLCDSKPILTSFALVNVFFHLVITIVTISVLGVKRAEVKFILKYVKKNLV